MTDWYDDDSFWETFRDSMFNPVRIELARTEVDSLLALLRVSPGAHILDLCCGPGRHSLEFARRGFAVTGVDRTQRYLDEAQSAANSERLAVELVRSDMRDFVRRQSFDAAINIFTSFGFFDDADDDLRVARNVCESLRPGSKFVIDVRGKELVARDFRGRDWHSFDDGTIIMEERRIRDGWSAVESRWVRLRGTQRYESTLTVRLYSGTEIVALLKEAGFGAIATYGNFAGASYDQQAERLIAVATK